MNRSLESLLAPLAVLPKRLLVGISGGIDSCSLLHALCQAGKEPIALHFDHGWRPESKAEAKWVGELCKQYGCRYVTSRAPARSPKTESSARQFRWAFFSRVARKHQCHDLVLAHHADDQVETFFMQLLRGTGGSWSGMHLLQTRGQLQIHRPWLRVWRNEIESYALHHGLSWKMDSTNLDPRHLRNRVRLEILPLLEKITALGLRRRLWQTAEILKEEQGCISKLVETEAKNSALPLKKLATLHVGHQRALIRAWLKRQAVVDLSFDDIEKARNMLTQIRPAKINLSRGRFLRRRAGLLFVDGP